MQQLENTLYLMTPHSYARLDHDTITIEVDHEKRLQVPLHHIGTVVCFGNVMLSPALLHRCSDDGIGVVLLDDQGRFKARLEGPISGNILLRQAQHRRATDSAFCLGTARAIVAGKIRNSRQVLVRGARESDNAKRSQSSNQKRRSFGLVTSRCCVGLRFRRPAGNRGRGGEDVLCRIEFAYPVRSARKLLHYGQIAPPTSRSPELFDVVPVFHASQRLPIRL